MTKITQNAMTQSNYNKLEDDVTLADCHDEPILR